MRPIIVYTTTDDVPEHLRCIAKFKDGGKLLPLVITGATPEIVRAKSVEWWETEKARQEKLRGRKPAAAAPAPMAMALLPSMPFAGLLPQ